MTLTIGCWADLATIVACFVTTLSLIVGSYQFYETQKSTRATQAVDLFLKFNQLNIDQGLSLNSKSDHWYDNSKFAITESLYLISYNQEIWRRTIEWMLSTQKDFIHSGGFEIDTYDSNFAEFCKSKGYELKRE